MSVDKHISLAGLITGMLTCGVLFFPQFQPARIGIQTSVEARGVDVHVWYAWGWPFVYRKSHKLVRYDKELDLKPYMEHYPDLVTTSDPEMLHRMFPEHDINAWVRLHEKDWDLWIGSAQWRLAGLLGNISVMLVVFVGVAFGTTYLLYRRAPPVPLQRPAPPSDQSPPATKG